jgi:succinate dehydrogenase / fumarate reductase, iron-sulfur subunit
MTAPATEIESATELRTVRVSVFRRKEGDDPAAERYDTFDVAVGPRATILDALVAIRRQQDATLAFRHSCFHASCGTCGMRVNGREGLACVTPVPAGEEVVVEPLANIPIVSDLVVDMRAFYDEFDDAGRPLVRRDDLLPECEPAEGIVELERYEDCIECGICLSACPVAGSDPRYVGPAALAAAWRVVEEPRGADPGPVLRLMDSEQAAWRCHVAWECSEACPSGVDPAGAIMRLRRAAVAARARRLISFGGTR